jgi:hypothetical protein
MAGGRKVARSIGHGEFRDRFSPSRAHLSLASFLAAPAAQGPASTVPRASILTVPVELITVWGAVITFMSGTSGLWAWRTGADVTACLEDGFIAGFICGLPITVCAAIAVIVWG